MKQIFKTMALLLTIISFVSCQDITTGGVTKITYYPVFTLNGGSTLTVELGKPFTDPGVVCMEGTNDISSKVVVTGSVNSNKVGIYTLTYSAKNVDGFSGTASRKVFVYDPSISADISGSYTVDLAQSNRYQFSNKATIKYSNLPGLYGGDFSNFTVDLVKTLPGIFHVNDLFGGYYFAGRKYASIYMMGGYLSLNKDNSLTILDSLVPGWGDSLNDLTNASYDPDAKTIKWGAVYANTYSFNVFLNFKQ